MVLSVRLLLAMVLSVRLLLAMVLSVLLRFADFDYLFDILKRFTVHMAYILCLHSSRVCMFGIR
jgi:hypothetical protein